MNHVLNHLISPISVYGEDLLKKKKNYLNVLCPIALILFTPLEFQENQSQ